MRNFKSIALIALLVLSNTAFAAGSTSENYDNATASNLSTSVGSFADAVSFNVNASTFTLPTNTLIPGATYTLTIPVENPTNRDITLSFDNVQVSGSAILVSSSAPLLVVAGDMGQTMTIVIKINSKDAIEANSAVSVGYNVKGTSIDY